MNKSRVGKLFWIIITIIPIIGLIFSLTDPKEFIEVQTLWRERINYFGVFGPIAFIMIQALQVVITPISHYTIGAIGGFLYGPYLGGLLNYIGRIIGHLSAFFLSKRIGRRIVNKFVDKETVEHFDRIVGGKGNSNLQTSILFLIYFLPLFPDDEVSYIVGLSKMSFRNFFLANIFGHIGGSLSLAYLGSGLDTSDPLFWFLFIITLLGFPIILYLQKKHINSLNSNK